MKTFVIFSILVSFSVAGRAQRFELKHSLALADTLAYYAVEWVDADSDGLLDLIAFAKNPEGEEIIVLFRNDKVNGPGFIRHFNTQLKGASFFITDFDGDNLMDVLASGTRDERALTSAFFNRENFVFEASPVTSLSGRIISEADFDQDGFPEMLLTGNEDGRPFLRILKHRASGWTVVHDSIQIDVQGIEVSNFDADNDMDFFVSGMDEHGTTVTRAFYNEDGFYFRSENVFPAILGPTSLADLNHDGHLDVLIAGTDEKHTPHSIIYMNTASGFAAHDSLMAVRNASILAADFNSDGKCDITLFGLLATGDTVNVILHHNSVDTLVHANVINQVFGDYDRDGDLDVCQLVKESAGYRLVWQENTNSLANLSPERPRNPIAANIFNRLFICWDKPSDDHTASTSLTYDLSIRSTGKDITTAEFDLINGRRLVVSHGNNGTMDYALLRTAQSGAVNFSIQAVDNSFHAGNGGVCIGSGGGGGRCIEMESGNIEACKNERITLTTDGVARWFSFREGFLGNTAMLTIDVQQPDTIFSVLTQTSGCVAINVYTIATPATLTRVIESTEYVCQGERLRKGVEPGWAQVEWSSAAKGFLSHEDTVVFDVSFADTLKVKVSDGMECILEYHTSLQISKPVIDIAHDVYQIVKGESVHLNVSGGASYEWVPATALSDPRVSNPVASPLKTTEYVIHVKDSIGCEATALILVVVEETAFIPTLFTPNQDGNNDVLKIYGLRQASHFSFTIYNREGSRVFHTENISEAVNSGWNGTTGGADQPAGVYYWNVNGETAPGKKVQLNGKISGSIVLVR